MNWNASSEAHAPLIPGAVYLGDNGRAMCNKCAGYTARTTAHDLSGLPLLRLGADGVAEFLRVTGRPPACECGTVSLSLLTGPDGWPATTNPSA